MVNHSDSTTERRRMLYTSLLNCANRQYDLISMLGTEDEYEKSFLQLSNEWDQLCAEVEIVQKEIGDVTQEDKELVSIMEEIMERLRTIDMRLQDTVGLAGNDLRTVKDQRMLVDAYYGMGRKGLDSMYFDEKK